MTMADPIEFLGERLREIRMKSGLSLREIARQLNVSPSFVSQIENGKSQPSVGTLYQLAQLLDVSIDQLFQSNGVKATHSDGEKTTFREDVQSLNEIWNDNKKSTISTISPFARNKIKMETGVEWQRLAATADKNINFMEVVYPAGSASNESGEFLKHDGYEYGYALEGEIEITIGDTVITLSKGHSIGFDSSVPHMLRNLGPGEFRGIWFNHECEIKREAKSK